MAISQLKIKTDLSVTRLMSEEIADILRDNIISGNINPGEKVNEYQVAKLLNISRPPIREAFRLLTAEGLITLVPRKGAFVSKLSIQEVKEIYEMKSMMESFAVILAIPTVDEREVPKNDQNEQKSEISPFLRKYSPAHKKISTGRTFCAYFLGNISSRT